MHMKLGRGGNEDEMKGIRDVTGVEITLDWTAQRYDIQDGGNILFEYMQLFVWSKSRGIKYT